MTLKNKIKKHRYFILALVSPLFAIIPLLSQYFPDSMQGLAPLFRLFELDICIKDGTIFPRWFPDIYGGLGGPFFNFYAPLSYYIAEIFRLAGFEYTDSLKSTYALSLVLSSIFMYLFAREFVGKASAFISSILYVYAPFHLATIYLRGGFAESFAFVFYPLILSSLHRLARERSYKSFLLTAISYAGLILTHNIMAMLFSAFLLAYTGFFIVEKKFPAKPVLTALLTGLLLTAFFWVPAMVEKEYVNIDILYTATWEYDYHNNLLNPGFFLPTYTRVFSKVIDNPFIVLQFGIAHTILSLTALLLSRNRTVVFLFSMLLFTIFMMTPYSLFIWDNISILKFVQFPWRLFGIGILLTSLLSSMAFERIIREKTQIFGLTLFTSILIVTMSTNFIGPPTGYLSGTEGIITKENVKSLTEYPGLTDHGEYLPEWAIFQNTTIKSKVDVLSGEAEVSITEEKCNQLEFKTNVKKASVLKINTFYFPGWTAYVDGKKEEVKVDSEGLMELYLDEGVHEIRVTFENTRTRAISNIVSIVAFLSLFLLLLYLSWRIYRPS